MSSVTARHVRGEVSVHDRVRERWMTTGFRNREAIAVLEGETDSPRNLSKIRVRSLVVLLVRILHVVDPRPDTWQPISLRSQGCPMQVRCDILQLLPHLGEESLAMLPL